MASIMNLFSAAIGLRRRDRQLPVGLGASPIGVQRTGTVNAFLRAIVFAIPFGVSKHYEAFLTSRIHEPWQARSENDAAVTHGLAANGRTINAASATMVIVFAAFILGGAHLIKPFAVGLASAVLSDALIVRSIPVPPRCCWRRPSLGGCLGCLARANACYPDSTSRAAPPRPPSKPRRDTETETAIATTIYTPAPL